MVWGSGGLAVDQDRPRSRWTVSGRQDGGQREERHQRMCEHGSKKPELVVGESDLMLVGVLR